MPAYLDSSDKLMILTPGNIFNFLAGAFCILLGWLYIIYPWYFSFGLIFGVIALLFIFYYPLIGLYFFLFLVYIRPQDFFPVLAYFNFTKLLAILMLVAFATKMALGNQPFVTTRHNRYLIMLTLLMLASAVFSNWPENALNKSLDFTKIVLTFFVIINLVDTKEKFRFLIWFFVLLNFIITGLYVWQYLSGFGYSSGRLMGLTSGFLGNADEIAITFIVCLPLTTALLTESKNVWVKGFLGIGVFFLFFATMLTKSRGALLSIFLVIFLLAISYRDQLKKIKAYQILFLLLFIAYAIFRFRITLLGLLSRTTDFADPSVTGRFDAWESAWKMIKAHPFLGIGRANFTRYWAANFPAGGWGQRQVAHNVLFEVGAETGLTGLLLYLLFSFQCFKDWWKHLRKATANLEEDQSVVVIARCLLISILGYFASGMFITIGFYWHLFLLVAFFIAAERIIFASPNITEWQK